METSSCFSDEETEGQRGSMMKQSPWPWFFLPLRFFEEYWPIILYHSPQFGHIPFEFFQNGTVPPILVYNFLFSFFGLFCVIGTSQNFPLGSLPWPLPSPVCNTLYPSGVPSQMLLLAPVPCHGSVALGWLACCGNEAELCVFV